MTDTKNAKRVKHYILTCELEDGARIEVRHTSSCRLRDVAKYLDDAVEKAIKRHELRIKEENNEKSN